jgi:hypothetical protein
VENPSFLDDRETIRSYLEIKKSAYEAGTAERKARKWLRTTMTRIPSSMSLSP